MPLQIFFSMWWTILYIALTLLVIFFIWHLIVKWIVRIFTESNRSNISLATAGRSIYKDEYRFFIYDVVADIIMYPILPLYFTVKALINALENFDTWVKSFEPVREKKYESERMFESTVKRIKSEGLRYTEDEAEKKKRTREESKELTELKIKMSHQKIKDALSDTQK